MKRPKVLTAAFVKTVTQPGRYGDGRGSCGLYLRVWTMTNGRTGKNWGQRLRVRGQITNLGLGSYPTVSLALARGKAIKNAQAVEEGIDPRMPVASVPSFAEAVDAVIASRAEGWKNPKTAKRWRAILETYAMPSLGRRLVNEITTGDVMHVLSPIWLSKPETGRQVREHLSVVMEWAIGQGFRADNPASRAIAKSLPKQNQRVTHFKALPFSGLGEAIRQVRGTTAWLGTKLCFEFLSLTASRSAEARLARWDEFDLDSLTWTIPASKMKNGLEHRVPLTPAAMDVLERAQELRDDSGLVFPSAHGKPMSDSTLSKLLRENGIETTPHGVRAAFRTWAAECSDVPREIAEFALAHVEGSAAELAYRRTDYFERRRRLMEAWADYITGDMLS